MYAVLFFGLPLLGLGAFLSVRRKMLAANVQIPSVRAVLLVFAAYGALLLIAVAAAFDVWSGMHSLGLAVLLFVGIPMLLWQGIRLFRMERVGGGRNVQLRQVVAALSVAFPLICAAVIIVASGLGR
jgi:ACR3 family arsenite efflux pump ArsB